MTGYREHSFDPNAYADPGQPIRPFNWVQWTGAAVIALCCAVELVHWAGLLGWIEPLFDKSPQAFLFVIVGLVLINSRREPGTPITDKQKAKNRRTLAITAIVCAVILGGVAALELGAFGR